MSLLVNRAEENDWYLYLALPASTLPFVTAVSQTVLGVEAAGSLGLVIVSIFSFLLYAYGPELNYIYRELSESLMDINLANLKKRILETALLTGNWANELKGPGALKNAKGTSPYATDMLEDYLPSLLKSVAMKKRLWRVRIFIYLMPSLIFLFLGAVAILYPHFLRVVSLMPFVPIRIPLIIISAVLGGILLLYFSWRVYANELGEVEKDLPQLLDAMYVLDRVVVADTSQHHEEIESVYNAMKGHLESTRELILQKDWELFAKRWVNLTAGVKYGLRSEQEGILEKFQKAWGGRIWEKEDMSLEYRPDWLFHLLYHLRNLFDPDVKEVLENIRSEMSGNFSSFTRLKLLLDLFPDNLFIEVPSKRGMKTIEVSRVGILKGVLDYAIKPDPNDDFANTLSMLFSFLGGNWPEHWGVDDAPEETSSLLIYRFLSQAEHDARTHSSLWKKPGGTGKVLKRAHALLMSLPSAIDRLPVFLSLARVASNKKEMAEFLDDLPVTDKELTDSRLAEALQNLPEKPTPGMEQHATESLRSIYTKRGLNPPV